MKRRILNTLYWISTLFVALICIYSGIPNVLLTESAIELIKGLGLPVYYAPFFGVMKILGAVTILIPQLHRLHEGAYAGLFFYFVGATYVNICMHYSMSTVFTSVILLAIIVSYFTDTRRYRIKKDKLENMKK